jgi:hypothetical protein
LALLGVSSLFGVPLHPLVVHAAVVLVPLSVIGLVASGWHPQWRRHYALPVALLAVGGAVAVILAASTGETLEASIRHAANAAGTRANMGEHPEQGETARLFAVLFAGGATAFWAIETWGARLRLQPWSTTATYAVSSVLGAMAIITIVIAGHSGAALVWKDVGNFVSTRR